MTDFTALQLHSALLGAVEALGYKEPTPIQARAIPPILAGQDVVAEARTGSGKTAAFALPTLHWLLDRPATQTPQILALAPTRELALQVAEAFRELTTLAPRPVSVLAVIGGVPLKGQADTLAAGVEVVVATPGRLIDLVENRDLDLSAVGVLILDEADKLLDVDFSEELARLLVWMPEQRQTLLFSATLPQKVIDLCTALLNDPVTVRIEDASTPIEGIEQLVYKVDADRRRMLLQQLIAEGGWGPTLVFVSTKRATENLAAKLRKAGLSASALHGGLDQEERVTVLERFKAGAVTVLVATDIAARGLDIARLEVVVNFDLPRSPRGYIHRIGRTGRAGAVGRAISFVDHDSEAHMRLIEKKNHLQLGREEVEGFELVGAPPVKKRGGAAVKGRRKSKKDRLREQDAARTQEPEPELT